MVEPAFRLLLTGDPAVNTLATGGVHHNVRPQDERRPSIVLTRVSTFFARRFGGDFGFARGRMQIDCLADTYKAAKELAVAAKAKLDRFKGTVDGTRFVYIEVEDERDVPAAPLKGQATPLFGVSVDVRFLYEE